MWLYLLLLLRWFLCSHFSNSVRTLIDESLFLSTIVSYFCFYSHDNSFYGCGIKQVFLFSWFVLVIALLIILSWIEVVSFVNNTIDLDIASYYHDHGCNSFFFNYSIEMILIVTSFIIFLMCLIVTFLSSYYDVSCSIPLLIIVSKCRI